MLRNFPNARYVLYAATLLVMTLAFFRVIDGSQAGKLTDMIDYAALAFGLTSPLVAMTNVRRNAIGGTPAEMLAAAVKAYTDARAAEEAALSQAMQSIPAGPLSDAIRVAAQQPTPLPVPTGVPVLLPPQEYAPTTYQPAQFAGVAVPATNGQPVAFMGGCGG